MDLSDSIKASDATGDEGDGAGPSSDSGSTGGDSAGNATNTTKGHGYESGDVINILGTQEGPGGLPEENETHTFPVVLIHSCFQGKCSVIQPDKQVFAVKLGNTSIGLAATYQDAVKNKTLKGTTFVRYP